MRVTGFTMTKEKKYALRFVLIGALLIFAPLTTHAGLNDGLFFRYTGANTCSGGPCYEEVDTADARTFPTDLVGTYKNFSSWPDPANTAFPFTPPTSPSSDGWWGGMGFICQTSQDSSCGNHVAYESNYPVYTSPSGAITAAKLCQIQTGDSTAIASLFRVRGFYSPSNETVALWVDSVGWTWAGGGSSPPNAWAVITPSDKYNAVINGINCITRKPPTQTLALDNSSIYAGQSTTLRWNDSVTPARNYTTDYDACSLTADPAGSFSAPAHTTIPSDCTLYGNSTWYSSYNNPWYVCKTKHYSSCIFASATAFPGNDWQTYPFACSAGDLRNVLHSTTVTGSLTVNPTVTTTYTYACENLYSQSTATKTLTVTSANLPDLTATTTVAYASPVSAGSAITYQQVIGNIGTTATGATFPVLFQASTNGTDAGAYDIGVISPLAPALATGYSQETVSFNYATSTTGTFSIRACANKTNGTTFGSLSELRTDNNCGAWTPVTVSTPLPDITVPLGSTITPNQATVGTPVRFAISAVKNQGTAASIDKFNVLFQISTTNSDTNPNVIGSDLATNVAALGVNTSRSVTADTLGYNFQNSDVGQSRYVRACAYTANNTAFDGPESDTPQHSNNCGAWTPITVTASCIDPNCPVDPDHALSCSVSTFHDANNNGIVDPLNESVTFAASPTTLGTTAYTWKPVGGANDTNEPSTYVVSSYPATGQYGMEVYAAGRNHGTCYVTVGGADCTAALSATLTATPSRVKRNDTPSNAHLFNWSNIKGVTAGAACTIQWPSGAAVTGCTSAAANVSCDISAAGSCQIPSISTQTTFNFVCGGATAATVTVDVLPDIGED